MARKARLTVFSRFIIMMLIVGPLAFLGASYYNGEDGMQTVKDLFNQQKEKTSETRTNRTDKVDETATYEIRKLEEDLEYKDKRIEELRKENEKLRQQIDKMEQEKANG